MPDITVNIGASNASLATVLADTQKRLAGLAGGVRSALAPLAAVAGPAIALVGLGAGFAGVAAAIKNTIDKGRDLADTMQRTGQSAGSLLKLQGAFRAAHLDVDSLGPAIGRLQKALSGTNEDGQDTSSVFTKLGLSAAALSRMDSATQFAQLGKALQGIHDPAERTLRVMEIFGKSGAEFLQLFNNGDALRGLTAGLSGSQAMMARSVALYAHIDQLWDAFIGKAKGGFGLFAGLAAGLAPALARLVEMLPKIDLSGFGKRIGDMIALVIQAFTDGRIGQLFGASLRVGIAQGINYLVGAMEPAAQALSSLFGGQLSALAGSLATMVEGLSEVLGASLMRAFDGPLRYFQAGLERALQTLNFLSDIRDGKKVDPLGNMSEQTRQQQLAQVRKLKDQLQAQGRVAGDSSYNNALKYEERLQNYDPSKYAHAPEEIEEIANRNKSQATRFGLDGSGRTAAEMERAGRSKLASSPEALTKAANAFGGTLKKFFVDWKPANVVDDKEAKGQLATLVEGLQKDLAAEIAKVNATSNLPNGGTTRNSPNSSALAAKQTPVSSLAKIGGGGYGARGLMTETNSLLKAIVRNTGGLKTGHLGPSWVGSSYRHVHLVQNSPRASKFA